MISLENPATVVPLKNVHVNGGFWTAILRNLKTEMIPYQWKALNDLADGEKSHCIANYRAAAGQIDEPHYGRVFQDSDLAKWLEAVAYSLTTMPDADLEKQADEYIDLIGDAQMPDGYLNTYYQLTDISKRWTNLRDDHELYCAGHMLEAAVAYYQATGKDKLLNIMIRYIEHIMTVIGPDEGKIHGYPGHQEIELALCKLYDVTGDRRFLSLAEWFINERGQEPFFFAQEAQLRGEKPPRPGGIHLGRSYNQSHLPVREQKTLEGHSVRALYMATGIADVALRTGDASLYETCRTLFDNVTQKRMYITGGVGSTRIGEAFTCDYDLPNDFVYAETCASVALIFFCQRMLRMDVDRKYADVMEQTLYNTCLAGMSVDQSHFFYVNPLTVVPEQSLHNHAKQHVKPERPKWYACACCPPNLARLLADLGEYQYTQQGQDVYLHLFLPGVCRIAAGDEESVIEVDTRYPQEGRIAIRIPKGDFSLHVRIPGWCREWSLLRNGRPVHAVISNGYAELKGPFAEDEFELFLSMPPRRAYSNMAVRDNIDHVAIMKGPLVYCLEEKDNGDRLDLVYLPADSELSCEAGKGIFEHYDVIRAVGRKRCIAPEEALYLDHMERRVETHTLTFIPYHLWGNRGLNEMTVWVRESL